MPYEPLGMTHQYVEYHDADAMPINSLWMEHGEAERLPAYLPTREEERRDLLLAWRYGIETFICNWIICPAIVIGVCTVVCRFLNWIGGPSLALW